jgi:hypothetical protein
LSFAGAIVPPAPGTFSTTIVWPSALPIDAASDRATVSVGPPAANGTYIVTGFVGNCCAEAVAANASARPATSAGIFGNLLIASPPVKACRCRAAGGTPGVAGILPAGSA